MNNAIDPPVTPGDLQSPASRPIAERGDIKIARGARGVLGETRERGDERTSDFLG
jgi:hypothetical protein